MRTKELKKVEFDNKTLSEAATQVYNNSSFIVYQDNNGVYYITSNGGESEAEEVGTLQDLNEYLEIFA